MPVTWHNIAFDCANPAGLAEFWAGVLERPVDEDGTGDFESIGAYTRRTGPAWVFVRVAVGKTMKNRVHPDLLTSNLDAEIDRIVGLGAEKTAEYEQDGYHWVTLTDPEGNEFDVIAARA
jgi:predicted enzyme related to lactoylglutathione lyase